MFDPIFTTDELIAATSDAAWLDAMLAFESALALSEAEVGIIPERAGLAIARTCATVSLDLDLDQLGREAREVGNPAAPLVRALVEAVGPDAGRYVHFGATSQDALDTAAMLVTKRAGALVRAALDRACDACAALIATHSETLLGARTLLQPAVPTTFAAKAAGWLDGLLDATDDLERVLSRRLAVELGGAGGTLASLGAHGPSVTRRLADLLGLAEPRLPWHTARVRIAQIAAALGIVAGVAGKISLDITLLMQPEVGEASEPSGGRRGSSSTLPHKVNPVGGASVAAAARRAGALAGLLLQGLPQEHERAVGAWQAEWQPLGELLRLAGGAIARTAETLEGLDVDVARMRANLDATGGLLVAERIMLHLVPLLGRVEAHDAVARASRRITIEGVTFEEALAEDSELVGIGRDEIARLLDPTSYLGSTSEFARRALAALEAAQAKQAGQAEQAGSASPEREGIA